MKKIRCFCDICLKEKSTNEYILPCIEYDTEKMYSTKNEYTLIQHPYISSEKKDICDDCANNIITAIAVANAQSAKQKYTEETLDKLKRVFGDITPQTIDDSAMEELKRMARGDE